MITLFAALLTPVAHAQWQPTHDVVHGPIVHLGTYLSGATNPAIGALRVDTQSTTWSWTGSAFPGDGFAWLIDGSSAPQGPAFANALFDPTTTSVIGPGDAFEVLACTAGGVCDREAWMVALEDHIEWFADPSGICTAERWGATGDALALTNGGSPCLPAALLFVPAQTPMGAFPWVVVPR